ncbi:holo-ACP synthase [Metabacillus idriensis]|uniref:holo-ACP synthase n=1 Tax=Metabacillus idriensis TaxID=324768 RepID=UPI003D2B727C
MIKGLGLDLAELDRIERLIKRQPKFIDRILTERERDKYQSYAPRRKIEYAAGRFAAKEAFSKAMGTGIGKELSFKDIEILNDGNGKPAVTMPDLPGFIVHVSITHTKDYAAAHVIIESSSS